MRTAEADQSLRAMLSRAQEARLLCGAEEGYCKRDSRGPRRLHRQAVRNCEAEGREEHNNDMVTALSLLFLLNKDKPTHPGHQIKSFWT
jgi:hypothetical protein